MPATVKKVGLFVTGTGTGVGKTIVTSSLALYLRNCGVDVGVLKPLETGVTDIKKPGPDGELLRWAAANTDPVENVCPYRFETPAAPATASRVEHRPVRYSELVENAKKLISRHEFTLVEGAGGLMVPIAGGFLISDLVKDLGLPLLVVADARLGAINHTLMTLLAARYFELEIAGYIINRMPEQASIAEESGPHDLASLTIEELLAVIPEVEGSLKEVVELIAEQIPRLPSFPLLKRLLPLDGQA